MRSGLIQSLARAASRTQPRWSAVVALLCGLTTAGCNTSGQPTASLDTPRGPAISGPSVAFESIDGPPPGVFQKLVQKLDDEATARQLPVVSRQGQANYRIRGYLAAHVAKNRTTFAWVWDVYDADQRRALRISGEVPGRVAGGDAWTGADDEVLRKIAQTGMDRVAAFIQAPAAMANAPAPTGGSTFALASAETAPAPDALPGQDSNQQAGGPQVLARQDDFAPEASGIFRLLRPSEPATAATAEGTQAAVTDPAVPMPRQRPANRGRKSSPAVALAAGPGATQD